MSNPATSHGHPLDAALAGTNLFAWFRPAFGLLGADPRFVAARPDYTVALAERMAQAQRADLALRVLQPYVKEQQQHRLHLAGAPQRSAT